MHGQRWGVFGLMGKKLYLYGNNDLVLCLGDYLLTPLILAIAIINEWSAILLL